MLSSFVKTYEMLKQAQILFCRLSAASNFEKLSSPALWLTQSFPKVAVAPAAPPK